ncbi:MAG: hypothetical protein A3F16_06525 [Deltaproteobacteria bacterium RIFCSPHIGHO2_12_FULL_43_9]|nr:MAG: hypothetical protein A3F16_06525 [Deltaproteobacteria bacterium RIFCSPHIGHO2_12_FULL_43_9]
MKHRVFQRIISLVPSTTETLFAIGAGEQVIGITSFCIHPRDDVRKITKVGGTKTLKIKKIIELKPDLVIANIEENVKSEIEGLQKANLNVHITHPRSCEDSIHHIRELGVLSGKSEKAEQMAKEQEKSLKEIRQPIKKRVLVLYLVWKNPYMTVNEETYIHSLIDAAGGTNVTAKTEGRYPEISMDVIEGLNPAIVLLPSEPYHFGEDDKLEFFKHKRLQAVINNQVHLINGEDTCWFGPRMANGLNILSKIFSSALSSLRGGPKGRSFTSFRTGSAISRRDPSLRSG